MLPYAYELVDLYRQPLRFGLVGHFQNQVRGANDTNLVIVFLHACIHGYHGSALSALFSSLNPSRETSKGFRLGCFLSEMSFFVLSLTLPIKSLVYYPFLATQNHNRKTFR